MRIKIILFVMMICCSRFTLAQKHISRGFIEYEVKTNVSKLNAKNEAYLRVKDQYPNFTTKIFSYAFSDTNSIYKFSSKTSEIQMFNSFKGEDDNIWYHNYNSKTYTKLINLENPTFLTDTITKLKWKISFDVSKDILGFDCRLAQTVLFDSVYVFAYFTEQIPVSGGPMQLQGLPGMILGLNIPRLYTTWLAVKIQDEWPDALKLSSQSRKTNMNASTERELKNRLDILAKNSSLEKEAFQRLFLWTFL